MGTPAPDPPSPSAGPAVPRRSSRTPTPSPPVTPAPEQVPVPPAPPSVAVVAAPRPAPDTPAATPARARPDAADMTASCPVPDPPATTPDAGLSSHAPHATGLAASAPEALVPALLSPPDPHTPGSTSSPTQDYARTWRRAIRFSQCATPLSKGFRDTSGVSIVARVPAVGVRPVPQPLQGGAWHAGRSLVDKMTGNHRRRLPSNRRQLPSNRRRLPSNRRRLPSNRRRLPSNRRR